MYKTIRQELRHARKARPGTLVDPSLLSALSTLFPPSVDSFLQVLLRIKGPMARDFSLRLFSANSSPTVSPASYFIDFAVILVVHILKRVASLYSIVTRP
jgi:hypothetical protein